MRISKTVLAAITVLIVALFATVAFAQGMTEPREGQVSSKAVVEKAAPSEGAGNMQIEEPQHSFRMATENFLNKNTKVAANDIRKGADFMKTEAGHATGEAKEALVASGGELDKLADGVERGTVTSELKLRDTFARAYLALAKQKNVQASETWAKKETKATGEALKSSANHIEDAMKEAGEEGNEFGKTVVKDTRVVSGKLIDGYGWVHEEVGKVIADGGEAISRLGKKVEPSKE